MAQFDDIWLTLLREAMEERVSQIDDCSAFIEDAKEDIARQLSHVENFVADDVHSRVTGHDRLLCR